MKNDTLIGVASRSFSKHPVLRAELLERYSNVRFNDGGVALQGKIVIGEFVNTQCPEYGEILRSFLPESGEGDNA